MKAKSARRTERLAQALKDNLKRRKEAGSKAPARKAGDVTALPPLRPDDAAKPG
ncbi:MAG TPA: hypothetical protein VL026_13905 [Rhizomicrobium sp.]|nr:hypothetical protein [Rhizomicrobium sp.]